MITLRHHIVSLVAVFLALAVGIVLGGGPLSEIGRAEGSTPADPGLETAVTAAQQRADFGDAFAGGVAGTVYAGRLTDRQVALVTVPGADEQVVTGLTERIAAAGGAVSARYDLTETMVGPDQKTLVDTLGSQLMTQQGDAVAPEATTYDRIGQLLGLAAATSVPEGEATNGKGRAILESLAFKYRVVLESMEELTGTAITEIRIVGGGSRNRLLNQFTADATGRTVVAGPVEATAIGNVLVQARALGAAPESLEELRALVRATHELRGYRPRHRA